MSQSRENGVSRSLVLNVLLLGVMFGPVPRRFDRSAMRQQRMEQAHQRLARQRRSRDFAKDFSKFAPPPSRCSSKCDRPSDEALRLLGAEPFDEAAYDRQEAKIDELTREDDQTALAKSVKQTVKDLTPEERRTFAEMLRRPPPPPRLKARIRPLPKVNSFNKAPVIPALFFVFAAKTSTALVRIIS